MLTFPVLLVIACAVMALTFAIGVGLLILWFSIEDHFAKQMDAHDAVMRRLDL